MHILDSLLSVIAPHDCLGCGWEGSLLCAECLGDLQLPPDLPCYVCNQEHVVGMVCKTCRSNSPLTAIRVRTFYAGTAKRLVHHLKFERAVAAAKPMACAMAELVPRGLGSVLVVPVPTATSRVRARGYDQAALLARQIAKARRLRYAPLLIRSTQVRQVGASRQQRRAQLKNAFHVRREALCRGSTIILVDDVLTTGSSLEAAAEALRASGAQRVLGLVFAYQPQG